ncbi:MAG TPA: hypothetical protein VGF24_00925 [Vicinamibacterales bacterium]
MLARREIRAYERRHGEAIDFRNAWWHPPVTPDQVLTSESAQIEAIGLTPIVSITDHDNIDASASLNDTTIEVPISFEWTVPFGAGFFHLGVHNLPRATAGQVFHTLEALTRQPSADALRDTLALVSAHRQTLIVLNHPLWDLAGVGLDDHVALVQAFITAVTPFIHAIELNGYRSWHENAMAADLAAHSCLPIISGGDRHGCAPNCLLNLTRAATFSEFVSEVRDDGRSVVLMLPAYKEPLVARKLATAADAVRAYPAHPAGQLYWTDRVSYEREGIVRPLSAEWPDGGPIWARSAIRLFGAATRSPWLAATRACVWLAGASMSSGGAKASSDRRQTSSAAARYQQSIG